MSLSYLPTASDFLMTNGLHFRLQFFSTGVGGRWNPKCWSLQTGTWAHSGQNPCAGSLQMKHWVPRDIFLETSKRSSVILRCEIKDERKTSRCEMWRSTNGKMNNAFSWAPAFVHFFCHQVKLLNWQVKSNELSIITKSLLVNYSLAGLQFLFLDNWYYSSISATQCRPPNWITDNRTRHFL